jgi:1-deoxy-D-xylulose-5-phosphate synthase
MGITPAMPSGCSLKFMLDEMPDRAFDVGIAEQHAVTFSAGLATQGLRPFCNIYSTFMQRAYDQVIHDVCIQKLPVVLCLDRGGLVGADGPTHHGAFDIAYFRCIPNLIVASPMNEQELRNMMYTAQLDEQLMPFSIRYPRGEGVMLEWRTPFEKMEIGKGRMINDGEELAILSFGPLGNYVQDAVSKLNAQGIHPAHFDMRFVKPIDAALLHNVFTRFSKVITLEDGCIQGGFGSAVIEFMVDNGYHAQVKRLGIPDRFIEHGTPDQLFDECGYGRTAIYETALEMASERVIR